jgi:hypothetical protein
MEYNIYQSSLFPKYKVSRHMWKCNFVYAEMKSVALLEQIFTKLTTTKQNFVTVFCTRFLQIEKQM